MPQLFFELVNIDGYQCRLGIIRLDFACDDLADVAYLLDA
jgi:hypothetical protein